MENLGKIDRIVRGVVGLMLLVVFIQTLDFRGLGLVGTLLMITAVLGFCPFYAWLGKINLSSRAPEEQGSL